MAGREGSGDVSWEVCAWAGVLTKNLLRITRKYWVLCLVLAVQFKIVSESLLVERYHAARCAENDTPRNVVPISKAIMGGKDDVRRKIFPSRCVGEK